MAVDPVTKEEYVLVRKDVYDKWRAVFEDEFDPRLAYPLVDRIMADDDANGPALETYQS